MFLKFSSNIKGDKLVLKSFNLSHNYETNNLIQKVLPKSAKLNDQKIQSIHQLLEVDGNFKTIQEKIYCENRKIITMKKLSNIKYSLKSHKNNFDFLMTIKNTQNSDIEILKDQIIFKELYFQDLEMKNCLKAYPDIIFLDATYKLLNCRAPVYFVVIIDARSLNELVAVGILVDETKDVLSWFINTFKKHNVITESKTKVFITDKDIVKRKVLKKYFQILMFNYVYFMY